MTDDIKLKLVSWEQPLSDEQKALLEEIYQRMETFEQANRPWHEAAKEAREILRLRDPRQDPPDGKEKTLQLPTLKSTFTNCVADQMQNLPEARILPETSEQSELAMDLQDMIRYVVYTVNDYESVHRRRSEDLYGPGTAVTQVAWDPAMRDIAIIRWPIEGLLWDPAAEDIQDARAIIKVSWHPLSWYRQHYPEEAPYIRDEQGMHNQVGLPDLQQAITPQDEGRAMLLEYWYRRYDAKKKRHTISVAYAAGGALIADDEDVYDHGLYPFVVDVHSVVEGSLAGDGMVGELADMMRYINRYARYIDTNLRMSSKGRMLVRKNAGIDRRGLADWSKDIIEGDSVTPGEDWNWMAHAPFNGMISQQMLQMQSDLKMDSGMNQYSRGETLSGVTSGKMLSALQTAGGKITSLRTATLNIGFRAMVEQIMWLMAQFYKDGRVLLVTGRDGVQRDLRVDVKRLFGKIKQSGHIPYLVQVEVNKRNPARVEAQNEMFMEAYTMAAQAQQNFPLSALFQLMTLDGKDRLMPIIEQNEQTQQAMAQLMQQNQQLTEQCAQLQADKDSLTQTSTYATNKLAGLQGQPLQGDLPSATQQRRTAQMVNSPAPQNPVNMLREKIAQNGI